MFDIVPGRKFESFPKVTQSIYTAQVDQQTQKVLAQAESASIQKLIKCVQNNSLFLSKGQRIFLHWP